MLRCLLVWAALLVLLAPPLLAAPPSPAASQPLPRALELRASGRLAEAQSLLEEYLARTPEDARARYILGVVLLESGQTEAGLAALLETLRRDPDLPEARASLAGAVQARVYELADRGACEEAQAVLVHLDDRSTACFLEGAINLERWRRSGDPADRQKALEAWARSRALKPVSAVSELLAGVAAFDGRDYARAAERFQYALQIRGRNRYARLWLGMAQAAQGQYDLALGTLEGCRDTFGGNPTLHRLLGDLHFALALAVTPPDPARLQQAEACYRRALELWPESPHGQAGLAELLRLQEHWEEAASCYARALQSRPEADLAMRAGWMLLETGRLEEARATFLRSLATADQEPESGQKLRRRARALVALALVGLEQGDPAPARALTSRELAPLSPSDPLRLLLEGALGTTEGRRAALRRALQDEGPEAGVTHMLAWLALARLEEQRENRVQALRYQAEALRLAPAGTPRAEGLQARFLAIRQAELEAIAAWEANNGLVFVADLVTGSSRAARLQARKQALEDLEPGQAGAGRQAPSTSPVAWPAELEGDLEPVQAARDRRDVQPPRTWLED